MAETPETRPAEQPKQPGEDRVLLVVIASDPTAMDDLFTALLDIGITGATVVESKGMAAVLREEMPIFAGLVALLPSATGSRMLFSIATSEQAASVAEFIENEERSEARPIAVVLPVIRTVGLRR